MLRLKVGADGKLATTIPARSAVGIHVGEVEVGGAGGIVGGLAPSHGQQNSKALGKVLLVPDGA